MNEILLNNSILPMNNVSIDNVKNLEKMSLSLPQTSIETSHLLHADIYARTIFIPEGVTLTGALIKIPTTLVFQGDIIIYVGDRSVRLAGYNVIPAYSNRKQAFFACSDTYVTMMFKSSAKTIGEAEDEFTEESDLLMSRKTDSINHITITGE